MHNLLVFLATGYHFHHQVSCAPRGWGLAARLHAAGFYLSFDSRNQRTWGGGDINADMDKNWVTDLRADEVR